MTRHEPIPFTSDILKLLRLKGYRAAEIRGSEVIVSLRPPADQPPAVFPIDSQDLMAKARTGHYTLDTVSAMSHLSTSTH